MIAPEQFVCEEFLPLIQDHISKCPVCSEKLSGVLKEFPVLRMIPGLETTLTEFLKGATEHGNGKAVRQGEKSKAHH